MKTVCAWCGEHLSGSKDDPDVSHGMCRACHRKQKQEVKKWQKAKKAVGK